MPTLWDFEETSVQLSTAERRMCEAGGMENAAKSLAERIGISMRSALRMCNEHRYPYLKRETP